jgi:hypothetical protein
VLTKTYNLEINLNNTIPLQTNYVFVQNDIDVYMLKFTILKRKTIVDLSAVTNCTITFKLSDNTVVVGEVQITDATNGKLQYELGTSEISVAGNVLATLEFYGVNNERLSSPQFTFKVIAELGSDEAIQSVDDYNILSRLLIAGQNENGRMVREIERINAEKDRDDAEIIRIDNEEIRVDNENNRETRLSNIETSINTINNVTIPNIKYYKWVEQQTVPIGSNTMTLTNPYVENQELMIYDIPFGCKWERGIHWNIAGQIITFTEISFTQEMIFKIYNLG